jgi:tRNA nucleotidyltransferase (CCA-adding enzyme)
LKDEVVQDILREGRLYEVGGCVRDALITHLPTVKDRDYLVCGIAFERLTQILKRHGRVDLVGRSFGVIKFTPSEIDGIYDISLPRRERSTGPGHTDFEVDFDPSLGVEADLGRRDFSINAIACDLASGLLVDPFDGQRDLNDRIIRMVAPKSFAEDPLRMLRAVQFAARFEFTIEPVTYEALSANVGLITTVSPERIAEELNKMLVRSARPSIGLRLMLETGLLHHILPELEPTVGCEQPGGYHAHDVFEHTVRIIDACPPRLHLRLAALFHDITKPRHKRLTADGASFYGHEISGAETAKQVLKRLRYSTDIIRDVTVLVERHMFTTEVGPKGLRRFIRRVGQRLIPDLLDLRRADVIAQGMGGTTGDVDRMEEAIHEEIERKSPFGRSDLAVNGQAIMTAFHLEPSPLVGDVLNYLLEKVLDDPAENQPAILLQHAGEFLKHEGYDQSVN